MSADALTRIRARGHIGIRLGLERMRALLSQLGDPQLELRGVLIAGTNGKGSVAAMVAEALSAAGYSTAQSPSPHLHSYRERITIDGQPIAVADLDPLLEEVLAASEPGSAVHGPATEFELLTAAAYLWFARHAVDVVVMEVGLGGRLDASNTWDPDVAAITNVGLDHAEFLGDTIASVAVEKAAIIRRGRPVVTGARGEALAIVRARARELDAPVAVCPPLRIERMDGTGLSLVHERVGPLRLRLLGRHQAANAAVAVGILDALPARGIASVDDAAIRAGLARARWPGRLELVRAGHRLVLLDGAHNPDGMRTLAATLDELAASLAPGRPVLVLGIMGDKAVAAMLAELAGSRLLGTARFIATRAPDSERALPAADLAQAWSTASGRPADGIHEDADAALEHALASAADDDGLVVVAGSLYLVGAMRARLLPAEAVLDDA